MHIIIVNTPQNIDNELYNITSVMLAFRYSELL